MKNFIFKSAFVAATLVLSVSQVSAQKFLKNVAKAASAVTQTAETTTAEATDDSTAKKLNLDIPIYHVEVFAETDTNGEPLKNEDGTPIERYLLVDQNGNIRSAEAVAAQHKTINKCFGNILAKVGGGAALGALTGGTKGAVAGAVAGLVLSPSDILKIKNHMKSLKQQKKLLEAYQQNFTNEGLPVDAKADVSNIKDLAINKNETATKTQEELDALLASEDYKTASANDWDFDV